MKPYKTFFGKQYKGKGAGLYTCSMGNDLLHLTNGMTDNCYLASEMAKNSQSAQALYYTILHCLVIA